MALTWADPLVKEHPALSSLCHQGSALVPERLASEGFALLPNFLSEDAFSKLHELSAQLQAPAGRGGLRKLAEKLPGLDQWIVSTGIAQLVGELLSPSARRIRSLFFDKTPENNWKVPWHQDLTIAVKDKYPLPGFGPWSVKEGVHHVQPPFSILQRCLTVRIHLDDCPEDNGALRIRPATHCQKGPGDSESANEVVCAVPAGGLLLMSPLVYHASSKSLRETRRRVIHLEYCDATLPEPLEWWESV